MALEQANAHRPGPWADDMKTIETEYLNGRGEFLVGEIESRIVAMGAFRPIDPVSAEIKRMRVHPDYQRQGLGQQLLDELERRAAELGYEVLVLDTLPSQTAARGLYEANGYQETGTGTFEGEEIVLYRKRLVG